MALPPDNPQCQICEPWHCGNCGFFELRLSANFDFPISNVIVAGIAECFGEESDETYSYSPYRAGDKDWQIFDNSIIDSDFFEDADACVDSPAAPLAAAAATTITEEEEEDIILEDFSYDDTEQCISVPSLGAARVVEKGVGVLKISILLGLILFAVVTEPLLRLPVLEIKHHPAFPQPVTFMELNDRIEWRGVEYQLPSREYLEHFEQLAIASKFHTRYHGAYDDPIPRAVAPGLALRDTEATYRAWHVGADGELVTPSATVHWLYYDSISGAVEAQPWEHTASSQLNTIPDLERATQYSISDGNTFLHPPPSSISSIPQRVRTSDRHLGMTFSTEAETCPLGQVPSTLRLGGRPEYPYGYQDGQLHSLRDSHSDLVWSNSTCCQLNLQSTEESGNHDSLWSRLNLEKMI